MKWSGVLVVGRVSLCCSVMVAVLLGRLSAEAASAHHRRMGRMVKTAKKVKESSVHVVSISECLKISGGPSTEHPFQLHLSGETLHRSNPFRLCLTVCLCGNCYTWTCVAWVCWLCTLDKIFFWCPARVTPILANSLQGR